MQIEDLTTFQDAIRNKIIPQIVKCLANVTAHKNSKEADLKK